MSKKAEPCKDCGEMHPEVVGLTGKVVPSEKLQGYWTYWIAEGTDPQIIVEKEERIYRDKEDAEISMKEDAEVILREVIQKIEQKIGKKFHAVIVRPGDPVPAVGSEPDFGEMLDFVSSSKGIVH